MQYGMALVPAAIWGAVDNELRLLCKSAHVAGNNKIDKRVFDYSVKAHIVVLAMFCSHAHKQMNSTLLVQVWTKSRAPRLH